MAAFDSFIISFSKPDPSLEEIKREVLTNYSLSCNGPGFLGYEIEDHGLVWADHTGSRKRFGTEGAPVSANEAEEIVRRGYDFRKGCPKAAIRLTDGRIYVAGHYRD